MHETQSRELGSGLTRLGAHDHPCLIYESPDEQADAFVPYLYAGLLNRELCVYVVDDTHPEFVLAAFRTRHIDVAPYVAKGAFRIINKHDAYLTEGYFDTDKMVRFWETTVADALANGFTAVRAAAEMTWALGSEPGVDQLVRYESSLNEVFPRLKVSALCQYHRRRFPARIIKEMIHVHPLVVTRNEVLKNPGFMPHEEYINSREDMEVDVMLDALKMVSYAEGVKAELEEFVNNATEGLHWVGPDGVIQWANRAELDMLGYTEEEYIGRNIKEIHADEGTINDIFERLQRRETLRNYPARLRAKDGSIKTVLINSNVLWRDGKFIHTQCFTRDITDIELAQRMIAKAHDVQQLNDELQSLARVVSHELQEPVAKIRSYLTLLSVRYKGRLGADADEFITICTEAAQIIDRMIDDLWLFARITRPQDHDTSEVYVGSVLSTVLEEHAQLIESTGAQVNAGVLPSVKFSERQLEYILSALIKNAITYRRETVRPRIELSSRRSGEEWLISVSDNGAGIDKMHFRDIFRTFFRIDATPNEKGTGMGLAICQKVVQAAGGRIWVESTPDAGSTFYFTVPAK